MRDPAVIQATVGRLRRCSAPESVVAEIRHGRHPADADRIVHCGCPAARRGV